MARVHNFPANPLEMNALSIVAINTLEKRKTVETKRESTSYLTGRNFAKQQGSGFWTVTVESK